MERWPKVCASMKAGCEMRLFPKEGLFFLKGQAVLMSPLIRLFQRAHGLFSVCLVAEENSLEVGINGAIYFVRNIICLRYIFCLPFS